jgi:hypothetical protein
VPASEMVRRGHEAAPTVCPGAAESSVSFIALFARVVVQRLGFASALPSGATMLHESVSRPAVRQLARPDPPRAPMRLAAAARQSAGQPPSRAQLAANDHARPQNRKQLLDHRTQRLVPDVGNGVVLQALVVPDSNARHGLKEKTRSRRKARASFRSGHYVSASGALSRSHVGRTLAISCGAVPASEMVRRGHEAAPSVVSSGAAESSVSFIASFGGAPALLLTKPRPTHRPAQGPPRSVAIEKAGRCSSERHASSMAGPAAMPSHAEDSSRSRRVVRDPTDERTAHRASPRHEPTGCAVGKASPAGEEEPDRAEGARLLPLTFAVMPSTHSVPSTEHQR